MRLVRFRGWQQAAAGVPNDLRSKPERLHRDLAKAKPSPQATKVAGRQDKQGKVLASVTALLLEDLQDFGAAGGG